jgi:hypothetical protein
MPLGSIIRRTFLALPLLALFFISFNFLGWLFWLGGFFIAIVALWHLGGELRKGRRRAPLLVLALVTLALFFGACGNHMRAFGQLTRETRAFAEQVHATCARDGVCPAEAKVCTPGAYRCREAGSLGIQLPIRYRLAEDARSFTVSSSMMSDDATSFQGGVARPLTRRHLMDGVDMNGEDAPAEVIVPFDAGPLVDAGGSASVDAGAQPRVAPGLVPGGGERVRVGDGGVP